MRPSTTLTLTTTLLLSTLSVALPQQSKETSTAVTVLSFNPINGLPLPVASTATITASASSGEPTSDSDSEESPSESDSESDTETSTITAAPTLSGHARPTGTITDTDSDDSPSSSTGTDSSSETESNFPSLITYTVLSPTPTTIIATFFSVTSDPPIPTISVPPHWDAGYAGQGDGHPDKPTVTLQYTDAGGHVELMPTKGVDTFVQGYTGGAGRSKERVWWLLGAAGIAAGAWGL